MTRPTTRPSRRTAIALALLLGLGSAATACSSDSADKADDDATTTVERDGTTTTATDDEGSTPTGDDETTTTEGDDVTSTTRAPIEGEADYVAAMAEAFQIYGTGDIPECLAQAWVDTLGYDELQSKDIAPEDLASGRDDEIERLGADEATGNELYDAFGGCEVDLPSLIIDGRPGETTPEQRACVEAILTDDALRASFVADITGQDIDDDALDEADDCFPDDDDDDTASGSADSEPVTIPED